MAVQLLLLNPGKPRTASAKKRRVTQADLDAFAGILDNPKRKKKSGSKSKSKSKSSNVGGKSMARTKTKRRKSKKGKARKRKTTRKKSTRRNVRKNARRKPARKRSKGRKRSKAKRNVRRTRTAKKRTRKARKNKGRKRSSRKRTRRNPVAKRNPAKRNPRRKKSRRRKAKRNYWPGDIPEHRKASKKGWRKRKRGVKGYKRPKMSRGRYPAIRNPQSPVAALRGGLQMIQSPALWTDVAYVTVGSVGAPIIGAMFGAAVEKMTGKAMVGQVFSKVMTAMGGVALSVGVTAATGSKKNGQSVLYGAVAGIVSDLMKEFIIPRLPFVGAEAAAVEAAPAGTADYLPVGVNDYMTVPPGPGQMSDYLPVGAGMGAYASVDEYQDARTLGDYDEF